MTPIGFQLRDLRLAAGLRQIDIAELVNVSQPTVSSIEKGQTTTTAVLEKWAEACGGTVEVRRAGDEFWTSLHAAASSLDAADRQRLLQFAAAIPRAPGAAKDGLIVAIKAFAGQHS